MISDRKRTRYLRFRFVWIIMSTQLAVYINNYIVLPFFVPTIVFLHFAFFFCKLHLDYTTNAIMRVNSVCGCIEKNYEHFRISIMAKSFTYNRINLLSLFSFLFLPSGGGAFHITGVLWWLAKTIELPISGKKKKTFVSAQFFISKLSFFSFSPFSSFAHFFPLIPPPPRFTLVYL